MRGYFVYSKIWMWFKILGIVKKNRIHIVAPYVNFKEH